MAGLNAGTSAGTSAGGGGGAVVAGLGMTEYGKVYGRSAAQFAVDATRLAAADAGMAVGDLDGLIVSGGLAAGPSDGVGLDVAQRLGLRDLRLLTSMQAYGSTAIQMVQYAAMAVSSGSADAVAVVWADAPLKPKGAAGAAYTRSGGLSGFGGARVASGIVSPNVMYALAARRHMDRFATTSDQLGAIAVAQREWAHLNPRAQLRGVPLTPADYHASRYIAEPFHLFDCCLVSNGGTALVVTRADRAGDLPKPAVDVLGWAQSHPGRMGVRHDDFGLVSGAARSGPAALAAAGVGLDEIDVFELYDCYTFTALLTVEDYGLCAKGEGGPFLAEPGRLGPGGSLRLNTGGGQLSSYYQWGMTPLSEAVIQARGEAGDRQCDRHDRVLVSGNGGILDHHSTLVLGAR